MRRPHLAPVPNLPSPTVPGALSTTITIAITPAELARLIDDAVRRALDAHRAEPVSEWCDADEAARTIGVSRDYLRRVQGLRRYGSPRAPRYLRTEIDAYLRDRAGAAPLNRP